MKKQIIKNQVYEKIFNIFLAILVAFSSCKKNDENTEWTQEDEVFYNNVISLQDSAYNEYVTWSQTLDSLEAINKLQQLFVNDPSVTSATVGIQGIAVQYSNGMRGGILLNPQDTPQSDTSQFISASGYIGNSSKFKSLVNNNSSLNFKRQYCHTPIVL